MSNGGQGSTSESPLSVALNVIIKGYAAGKAILDGDMLEAMKTVSDHAEEILALLENRRLHPCFVVTGRIPGDDDDTTKVFYDTREADARAMFESEMYADVGSGTDHKAYIEEKYGAAVYITNLLKL